MNGTVIVYEKPITDWYSLFRPQNHLSGTFLNEINSCDELPKEFKLSEKGCYTNDLTLVSCNKNHSNDRISSSGKNRCYKLMVHSFLERVVKGTEKKYKFQRTVC